MDEHLFLANFIKSVHKNLRTTTKQVGVEQAWLNHCENTEILEKYASSMKKLAEECWARNKQVTRIEWVVDTVQEYFYTNLPIIREREEKLAERLELTLDPVRSDFDPKTKLKLLDVGSCYNPFKKYDIFETVAIDIAPASQDVIKCDFLQSDSSNLALKSGAFHVVVFSLVLEYLPSAKQRLQFCKRAYSLLEKEGLLVIVTPDSNPLHKNSKIFKSWQFVLADLGFVRVRFEKMEHLCCMAFRKALNVKLGQRWADIHKSKQEYSEIFIPQDLNGSCEEG